MSFRCMIGSPYPNVDGTCISDTSPDMGAIGSKFLRLLPSKPGLDGEGSITSMRAVLAVLKLIQTYQIWCFLLLKWKYICSFRILFEIVCVWKCGPAKLPVCGCCPPPAPSGAPRLLALQGLVPLHTKGCLQHSREGRAIMLVLNKFIFFSWWVIDKLSTFESLWIELLLISIQPSLLEQWMNCKILLTVGQESPLAEGVDCCKSPEVKDCAPIHVPEGDVLHKELSCINFRRAARAQAILGNVSWETTTGSTVW